MAQAPATPKLHRALRLTAASFGLDSWVDRDLASSERAALALRHARRQETWRTPNHVTFLIPLVGPHAVKNWAKVTSLLMRTLDSLRDQSTPNWRAVICCQVKPLLPEDPRIRFLPFKNTEAGNDKWRKLAALYMDLSKTASEPGLAMTFDADDLAAPTLVDALLKRPSGALLTHGFVYDVQANRLALAAPQSIKALQAKAFWKLCGSCAAVPYDPSQASATAQFAFLVAMSQHEHRMVPYLARMSGTHLSPLAAPHALYMLNHGDNFGARRGRVSFKTRFVQRFEVKDISVQHQVRAVYALPPPDVP